MIIYLSTREIIAFRIIPYKKDFIVPGVFDKYLRFTRI